MKSNKILIVSMILIALFAIGAVSAGDDNATDVVELSDVDEVQAIDDDVNQDSDDLLCDGQVNDADKNPKVNVSAKDVGLGENITVDVSVYNVDENYNFSEVGFNISIDGSKINDKPFTFNDTGKAQISFKPYLNYNNVGKYYVEAMLYNLTDGSKIINGGNSFNILPYDYTVTVENVEANVYDIVTIPVTVTDSKGNKTGINGQAIVTIFWSGDSLSKRISVENGEGQATFNFTDILGIFTSMDFASMMGDNGAMDWSEMFSGAGYNTSSFDWKNMNWSNMGSMFSGDGGMNWSAMFSGDGDMSNALSNMMKVTFEYIFTPGKYNVTTTFLESRNNNAANTTSNLTILYLEDVAYLADITLPKKHGGNTTVKLTVVDKRSNPLANLTVSVLIDGKTFGDVKLNENATAKFVLTSLENGVHKLEFSSVVEGNKTNGTTEFIVDVPNMNTKLTANAITIDAVNTAIDGKIGSYFSVTLKDDSGNALANKNVQIIIAATKYTATTGNDGVAKIQLNIAKADTYTCSICFLGDDVYNSAFEMVKVTVKKQSAKITPAKKSYKFKAKAKKTVKVTLKNAKGKAIKGKTVTLKIKNKTFKAKTNAKGVASIKVKFTKKGKYTAKVSLDGDSTYQASSKVKLTLK